MDVSPDQNRYVDLRKKKIKHMIHRAKTIAKPFRIHEKQDL